MENQEINESLESENKIKEVFDKVNDKTLSLLSDYLQNGYKKNLAKVLVYMGKDRALAEIEKFPEPIKADVQKYYSEMADKKASDPEMLEEVSQVFRSSGYNPKDMSNDVLKNIPEDSTSLQKVIKDYFEKNPILSINVDYYAFSFEDLIYLSDRDIQKLLRELDYALLAMALRGSTKVAEKIFTNMSKRAACMLKEDIEFFGPVRDIDVRDARRKIINIVKKLEEDGEIVILKKW